MAVNYAHVVARVRDIIGAAQGFISSRYDDVPVHRGVLGYLVEARELTRIYAGADSSFYKALVAIGDQWNRSRQAELLVSTLSSFVEFLESGLQEGVSIKRQAEIDVVSDILGQAAELLESSEMHPAAAAVLIGAALEEFLCSWCEEKGVSLGEARPSISAYAEKLRVAGSMTKQDIKDVTSWAGLRNSAAHGKWEEVSDRQVIRLMLAGVNHFMRVHGNAEVRLP